MNKLLLFLPLPLLLISCEIHHTGKWSYDVHWWVIAIPVAIIVLLAYLISGKIISKHLYICPKCGNEFYPNRWTAAFSIHDWNDERVLRCPNCKRKGFCKRK